MSTPIVVGTQEQERSNLKIIVWKGDTFGKNIVEFIDSAGDPVDISTWDFHLSVEDKFGDEVLNVPDGDGSLIQSSNKVELSLTDAETDAIDRGRYRHTLRVERAGRDPWYAAEGYFVVDTELNDGS
jgi:hypothetical protein